MVTLPADLFVRLRLIAAERRCTINRLLIEACEELVLAHQADAPADAAQIDHVSHDLVSALRRDLHDLRARVAALEQQIPNRGTVSEMTDERERLDADGVRREARALIQKRGHPIKHSELYEALSQKFVLPGRNPSENLRTILVHPKAKGFYFTRSEGYNTS